MRAISEDPPNPDVSAALPRPPRWRWRWRRVRNRPLQDPLSQSVIALSSSLIAIGSGLGLAFLGKGIAAAAILCLAAVSVAVYTALALRAFKRDRAVRYWLDRRDLRLELTERNAQLRLQAGILRSIHTLQRSNDPPGDAHKALAGIVEGLYEVVERATGADVGVVLALEANHKYRILCASTSRRSRWSVLSEGKQCSADRPFEETLAQLSRFHRALGVETQHGRLRMVVLSERPLKRIDEALFDGLPIYLGLVADRWSPARAELSEHSPLSLVS